MTDSFVDRPLDDDSQSSIEGSSLLPVDLPSPLSSIGSTDTVLHNFCQDVIEEIALLEQDNPSSLEDPHRNPWIFDGLDERHVETVKVAWKHATVCRCLHLQGVEVDAACAGYLINASSDGTSPSLQSSILEKCSFVSKSVEQGFWKDFLAHQYGRSLQELSYIPGRNLPPSKRFVDPILGQLISTLSQFICLQRLYWEGCNFTTLDKTIFERHTEHDTIIPSTCTRIEFRHCLLDATVLQFFALSTRIQLILYSCNLHDGEVTSFFESAYTLQRRDPNLGMRYLDLSFNALTIQSVPYLTRILKSNPFIETLNIGWNNNLLQADATSPKNIEKEHSQEHVVHDFLHTLAHDTRNLQKLDLSRSGMSQKTLSFFVVSILPKLTQLKSLNFCEHYQMDPQDWARALPHMVSLKHWNLSHTVWQDWLYHDADSGRVSTDQHQSFMSVLMQNMTLTSLGDEANNVVYGSDLIRVITRRNAFLQKTHKLLSLQDSPPACIPSVLQKLWSEKQPDSVYIILKGRVIES